MAIRLAQLYGHTECKAECPFFTRFGACRYGENCSRVHTKPGHSRTVILPLLYEHPAAALALLAGQIVSTAALTQAVRHHEDFYEQVWLHLSQYGKLLDLRTCDNLASYLLGNVYATFESEEAAERAVGGLNGQIYSGKVVQCRLCSVSDFSKGVCKLQNKCSRKGHCSFQHFRSVSSSFLRSLKQQMHYLHPEYKSH